METALEKGKAEEVVAGAVTANKAPVSALEAEVGITVLLGSSAPWIGIVKHRYAISVRVCVCVCVHRACACARAWCRVCMRVVRVCV
jgi:hypothetical protein